ncbi:hypothetical protein LINGRAHAP2_LOCUS14938 [Linum grandiflorum]
MLPRSRIFSLLMIHLFSLKLTRPPFARSKTYSLNFSFSLVKKLISENQQFSLVKTLLLMFNLGSLRTWVFRP